MGKNDSFREDNRHFHTFSGFCVGEIQALWPSVQQQQPMDASPVSRWNPGFGRFALTWGGPGLKSVEFGLFYSDMLELPPTQ